MTDGGWPPRWTGPQFKTAPGSKKVKIGMKREARLANENSRKQRVRNRDKYCRFPLCGCRRFALPMSPAGRRAEVSHFKHKGMGGNPAEDRSEPEIMVLVCSARHKSNVFAIDRKTIRWRALTPTGANGPIAWDIAIEEMRGREIPPLVQLTMRDWPKAKWFELAREKHPHVYETMTAAQTVVLSWLRGMEL